MVELDITILENFLTITLYFNNNYHGYPDMRKI